MLAFAWRLRLFRTTFVAITGSLEKTTAKECPAAILSSRFTTHKTCQNQNAPDGVVVNIPKIRPWYRCAVFEVAGAAPDGMRQSVRVVRPDVAVVLKVPRTHATAFRDLEQRAAEKFVLLESLPPRGLALLSRDDPLVACSGFGSLIFLVYVAQPRLTDRLPVSCRIERGCKSIWPARLSNGLRRSSQRV